MKKKHAKKPQPKPEPKPEKQVCQRCFEKFSVLVTHPNWTGKVCRGCSNGINLNSMI